MSWDTKSDVTRKACNLLHFIKQILKRATSKTPDIVYKSAML